MNFDQSDEPMDSHQHSRAQVNFLLLLKAIDLVRTEEMLSAVAAAQDNSGEIAAGSQNGGSSQNDHSSSLSISYS